MTRALTPNILIGHCDLISRFSDFALYLDTQLVTGGHQGSYLENVLTQICSHATSGNCRGSGNPHNWKYTQR